MAHGGGTRFGHLIFDPNRKSVRTPFDPGKFAGYSYFLREPTDGERSRWGIDFDDTQKVFTPLYSVLPQVVPEDNQNIPAGYTYLLQLVAHDFVNSTEPLWVATESGVPVGNARSVSLQLDTLYGGGPNICPWAFGPGVGGATPDYATKLRLGRVSDAQDFAGMCPFRDVPRVLLPVPSQQGGSPAGANASSAANFDDVDLQLFLADVRNGEGAILAQLAVLFFVLHNAIVDRLRSTAPLSTTERFAYARTAVLRMYRSVIRHDLLKRLLHQDVYAVLHDRTASDPNWLWRCSGIPYEFSHGAFRIGHSMPRATYNLNERLGRLLSLNEALHGATPRNGPLPSNWILEWGRFFSDLGGTPNYAMKFAASQWLPLNGSNLLPMVTPDAPGNILLRDWLSAAAARMWRTEALITALPPHYSGMAFLRADKIKIWLDGLLKNQPQQITKVLAPRINELAEDMPLPLYALLEAHTDAGGQGTCVGLLASIIIGEVIFRRLCEEEEVAASDPLAKALEGALNPHDLNAINSITCMPALVRLTADWSRLDQCRTLPFVNSTSRLPDEKEP